MISSRIRSLFSLQGKVVLVTGASEGIGAALARVLQARGARLALTARTTDKLVPIARREDLAMAGDLTDQAFRRDLIATTVARFGQIDVLINNAGRGAFHSLADMPLDEARGLFELNFFAPFHLVQLAAPDIRRVQGTIVNVSSMAGEINLPWLPMYSATKHALLSLTSTQRMEFRRHGVHVMSVLPGYVETRFLENSSGPKPADGAVRGRKYAVSPGVCAEAIVQGIEQRKKSVVTPRAGMIPLVISRLIPDFFESRF